jgi:tetratricopeptide (TPR) repeat protein
VAAIYRASLGNVGTLHCALGNFDKAIEYFERALIALPSSGAMNNARLDSMARVHLLQGRLDECGELLDRVDASIRSDEDRALTVTDMRS